MFQYCQSLTKAPNLPATTIQGNCYNSMFKNCTSLTSVPIWDENVDITGGWIGTNMFYGCSSLKYIVAPTLSSWSTSIFSSWLRSVSSSGTFIKSPSMTSLPGGVSGIPTGWSVEDYVN